MREIKFRGKRVDNGEWVYGYYFILPSGASAILNYYMGYEQVAPDTVGQLTGLTDKNGTKIFEGDIVKIVGDSNNDEWKDVNYTAQIVFLDNSFCAINGTIDNYSLRRYGLSRDEFDLEVVGNIHDNKLQEYMNEEKQND